MTQSPGIPERERPAPEGHVGLPLLCHGRGSPTARMPARTDVAVQDHLARVVRVRVDVDEVFWFFAAPRRVVEEDFAVQFNPSPAFRREIEEGRFRARLRDVYVRTFSSRRNVIPKDDIPIHRSDREGRALVGGERWSERCADHPGRLVGNVKRPALFGLIPEEARVFNNDVLRTHKERGPAVDGRGILLEGRELNEDFVHAVDVERSGVTLYMVVLIPKIQPRDRNENARDSTEKRNDLYARIGALSRTVYASLGDNKTPEHSLSLNSISSHFYARRDCMSKTGRMNRPALGFYCALPFLPVRNTCAFDQSASKSRSPSEEKVR